MASAGSGRRGRPPEFIDDGTPPGARHGGAPERVGWLLRRCRLHLRHGRFARQRAFVQALSEIGVSTDVSRVSRWEKNELDVPAVVVAAYEQLLGLPAGSLQATARGLYGTLNPRQQAPPLFAMPPAESTREAERRALSLIDVVTDGTPTGGQWCELVERLARAGLVIMPDGIAENMVRRLFSELARSIGPAFVTRYEALRRLCTLPRFLPVALSQIEEIAREPWSGVLMDVVAVLVDVPGPEADEVVVRLVRDDDTELQHAGLWCAASRVSRGNFSSPQLAQLEHVLVGLLSAEPQEVIETAATDVISCLPVPVRQRVLDAVAHVPGSAGRRRAVEVGELVSAAAAAQAARAIAREALRLLSDSDSDDPMLIRIVREALAHASRGRRHQASVLLMVGPFRRPVADALLSLWPDLPPDCRVQAATLLPYLVDDSHLEELDRRVSAHGPVELVLRSWIARAFVPRPVDDPGLLSRLPELHPELTKSVLYAMGMSGSPQLQQVMTGDLPEEVKGRARWWLAAGPAVRV
jgi:hypothetical protein